MDLEKLYLVELNAQEVQETEGGWVGAVVAACLLYFATETITNPVSSNNSLNAGIKAGKK